MRLFLLGLALLTSACAGPIAAETGAVDTDRAAFLEDGRAIARMQCSGCHAIGTAGASPRVDAPPLRYVLAHYRADALTEDLNEGMRVGHPDMPQFHLPIQGVDALIAYLQSIQKPPPAQEP
jgi:mono/diheme cytochrome c family protein